MAAPKDSQPYPLVTCVVLDKRAILCYNPVNMTNMATGQIGRTGLIVQRNKRFRFWVAALTILLLLAIYSLSCTQDPVATETKKQSFLQSLDTRTKTLEKSVAALVSYQSNQSITDKAMQADIKAIRTDVAAIRKQLDNLAVERAK